MPVELEFTSRWIGHKQGRGQDLELRGAVLLLAMCSGSNFWLYCLAGKGFFLFFLFLCVCRVCPLLVKTKLFYLKFFKVLSCLFFVKLDDYSQIFFFLALILPIGNFCCWIIFWACIYIYIYFFFNFRSINFFMDFKRRKILD